VEAVKREEEAAAGGGRRGHGRHGGRIQLGGGGGELGWWLIGEQPPSVLYLPDSDQLMRGKATAGAPCRPCPCPMATDPTGSARGADPYTRQRPLRCMLHRSMCARARALYSCSAAEGGEKGGRGHKPAASGMHSPWDGRLRGPSQPWSRCAAPRRRLDAASVPDVGASRPARRGAHV
jgi:hypothetical protein